VTSLIDKVPNDADIVRTATTGGIGQHIDFGFSYVVCRIPPSSSQGKSGLISYGVTY